MSRGVVVLLSGGMDSVSALYRCREEFDRIVCVSFDYGSKHNHREIPMAAYHAQKFGYPHHVIKMDFVNELFQSALLQSGGDIPEGHYEDETMKATVVPFRNGIMLSIAAGVAESHELSHLCIAAHAGDHAIYPDCRADFMDSMAQAIQLGTYNQVEIFAPFVNVDKAEIATIGHQLGVDFAQTWSCYKGNDIHCGKCGTCVERKEAFELAGVEDPTVYE